MVIVMVIVMVVVVNYVVMIITAMILTQAILTSQLFILCRTFTITKKVSKCNHRTFNNLPQSF